MTFANVKGLITKTTLAAVAAAAFLFAAPTRSQAQVIVGLRFGRPAPVYVAPAPYVVYRRDAFIRHEEWLRAHRYDHGYYRGYR
jgi:hypothetical protein